MSAALSCTVLFLLFCTALSAPKIPNEVPAFTLVDFDEPAAFAAAQKEKSEPVSVSRQSFRSCVSTFPVNRGPVCTALLPAGTIFHFGSFGSTIIETAQIGNNRLSIRLRAVGSGVRLNTIGVAVTTSPTVPSFPNLVVNRAIVTGTISWAGVSAGALPSCCNSQYFIHVRVSQCRGASCNVRSQSFSRILSCGRPCP